MRFLVLVLWIGMITGFFSCQDKHVIRSEYFPGGELKSKTSYLNDTILDGIKETYYLTGVLSSRMNFERGVRNGKFEIFHRSGALHVQGENKNDLPFGHIVEFYDSNISIPQFEYYSVIAEGSYQSFGMKEYNKAGKLVWDGTSLRVSDFNYRDGHTTYLLTYINTDTTQYDSMQVIVGPFKHGFAVNDKTYFDTIALTGNSVRISWSGNLDTLRAKFLTYRAYDGEGDTVITDMHYFYFEKPVAEIKN
jgi:hypothetical protein